MNDRPIGIIDSGIGGISILNEVIKYLPNENYIYYADSINNPYGNKTQQEIINIMKHIMNLFIKKNVKLVIVACNTASTQAISYLRETYSDILFVAVEPAIKVAYDYYKDKNVLVMATPGTIHSDRLMSLAKNYYQENRILLSCNGLAELIENQKINKVKSYLKDLLKELSFKNVEVVILGCTHYPFIKKEIEESIGHKVIFVDGSIGVKNRVIYLLEKNNIKNNIASKGKINFIVTKKETKRVIKKYLKKDLEYSFHISSN